MRKNQQARYHEKGKKLSNNGYIRLISGKWRGKKLPVQNKEGLRPTTDRTKETLFNWLMNDIRDAKCLDCFSGSGSLAFEALSRSAQDALLLERDKQVARQLKNNLAILNATNAKVIETDSIIYLQKPAPQQFDIVFVDPPFNKDLVSPCCHLLESNGYLKPEALIYIEVEVQLIELNIPDNWLQLKIKNTGQVSYQLYLRKT